MSRNVVICEICGLNAVIPIREEPNGVKVWRCNQCGDMKRWCADCDQGWIRHMRLPGLHNDFYSCDECEATYVSLGHDGEGTLTQKSRTNLQDFLDQRVPNWSWADVAIVRETEDA